MTDFDYTITMKCIGLKNGDDSSYALYALSPYLTDGFKKRKRETYSKYSIYEKDYNLTTKQREQVF